MSRRHRAGTERNAQGADDLNIYETPPEAVWALLGVEALPQYIWEPACGSGNIVEVLREAGRTVTASDIRDAGCERAHVQDFMAVTTRIEVDAIVTNPPFNMLSKGWIERCMEHASEVHLLARIQLLEGASRTHVIEKAGLRRVYVFRERLPMMHKAGHLEAGGKASTSTMAFAWFSWRRGWRGQAAVKRISWRNPLPPKGIPQPGYPKARCRHTQDLFA